MADLVLDRLFLFSVPAATTKIIGKLSHSSTVKSKRKKEENLEEFPELLIESAVELS